MILSLIMANSLIFGNLLPAEAKNLPIAFLTFPPLLWAAFRFGRLGISLALLIHAGFAAWHLLFYALWHRRHVEGRRPEGDVFEALAAR